MASDPSPHPERFRQIQDLVLRHYGLEARGLRELPGEYDHNVYLRADNGSELVLKIAPSGASPEPLHFQHALIAHLAERANRLSVPRPVNSLRGKTVEAARWDGGQRYIRLLRWLPGRPWAQVNPHSPELLASLGRQLGRLSAALADFDHPDAPTRHEWDLLRVDEWTDEDLKLFRDPEQRALATWCLDLFHREARPTLPLLPRAICYHDANDWNVIVSPDLRQPEVQGFIDYGDAQRTLRVGELAVALAYALMDKEDPMSAAFPLIQAYQRECPLREVEIDALFSLIGARLLLSVTHAARRARSRPENAYLQISNDQAWRLLRRLREVPSRWARAVFRLACGWPAHPQAAAFTEWASKQTFQPVVDFPANERTGWIDLSAGSPDQGHSGHFLRPEAFQRRLRRLLEDKGLQTALGGYHEVRPFYRSEAYAHPGLEGPEWRTLHLGLDIWQPAGAAVYAPSDGVVVAAADNAGERNYGPTIILRHAFGEGHPFYTLYGHLDRASLEGLTPGDRVSAGQRLGRLGRPEENGNWPPHLHWQVMLDLFDDSGDFPGVGLYRWRTLWRDLCPDPARLLPAELPPEPAFPSVMESMLDGRRRHLGPNLSLSYQEPLYMVRGMGAYLYDHTGRRFLDTVNNVAHVGHEHPRVVEALQRQAAVLNTNTRYLHPLLPRYAERLLGWFPEPLSVVYLVNSGSEANELALRMVRTLTGRREMLAMQVGYHGNTGATIDVSAYKFAGKGGSGRPASTLLLPMPDPLRQTDEAALTGLEETLAAVPGQGDLPAGFIAESILSCGGQVPLPPTYLQKAYAAVRSWGGLCIADEVQTGFGRVGGHRWAFEPHGVVPDIVTLGKPIGNGHPLGAVVCTREVAEAFDNGMEYFNTFGGNPVSCAVGLAVLDVMEEEQLQENARRTGAYLRERLLALQAEHPLLGQVRGPGFFQGLELIRDPETLEPATEAANYLINRMRRHGILMSTDGPFENVLKIKPPMVFGRAEADFLVETLDKVLREDFLRKVG